MRDIILYGRPGEVEAITVDPAYQECIRQLAEMQSKAERSEGVRSR